MAVPSTGVLKYGERAAREVSMRYGGTYATEALLKAIGSTYRTDGQVFFAADTKQLWQFDAASSAIASDDVLVPTVGTGRFVRAGGVGKAPVKGTNLTDASPTLVVTDGKWRVLPAATLTAPRTITLGTTGAVAGDNWTITRLDVTANTLTIVDGGAGTPTLMVMPVSKIGFILAQFDGTNWFLKHSTPN